MANVVGGDGAIILYEGEIREVCINFANAGTVPIEQAHVSLSGKNQDAVISIADEALQSALPLKPGAQVTLPVTLKAWHVGPVDSDNAVGGGRNAAGNTGRPKDGTSPSLLIHYAGTYILSS